MNKNQIFKELVTIQENTLACLQGVHAIGKNQTLNDTHLEMLEIIKDELNTMNNYLLKIASKI